MDVNNTESLSDLRFCPRCAGTLELRPCGDAQVLHPACGQCGFILWQNRKPCVDALIVRGRGVYSEVLLGEQSNGSGWDLPGNFLNADDFVEPALRRECRREMGIEVEVQELLCACEGVFRGIAIITLVYLCRIAAGEPQPADLIDEVRWFPVGATPVELSESGQFAVQALQRRIGQIDVP